TLNYDRIKTDLVVQYLKQYDLPLFGDLEERAKRLANYFATAHGKTTIAQCSNCNGLSDANLDECPFCGDNEPISDGGEAHEIAPVAEPEVLPAIEPPVSSSSKLTSADLDNAVQTIRGCVQQAIHNVHIIGRVLKRVRVLELWTLRTNARGEPIYSSFWEFCSSEVG
ncbi:MAG: hypothetical protein GY854_10530, partial [Deltaproteobacteria bacterium]|nr:hypothetical protein [Deltaproteobacteria bacterium]